jgi:hypothetical protein
MIATCTCISRVHHAGPNAIGCRGAPPPVIHRRHLTGAGEHEQKRHDAHHIVAPIGDERVAMVQAREAHIRKGGAPRRQQTDREPDRGDEMQPERVQDLGCRILGQVMPAQQVVGERRAAGDRPGGHDGVGAGAVAKEQERAPRRALLQPRRLPDDGRPGPPFDDDLQPHSVRGGIGGDHRPVLAEPMPAHDAGTGFGGDR